jgi:ribose 5-phosphate isomerase B
MLYLAADHRGFKLKNQLKNWLLEKKIPFKDLGAYGYDPDDDYPDLTKAVCKKVLEDKSNKGVVLCGSGAGVCITANKIKGIRCGLGFNHRQVKSFVEDDDVRVLAVASDYTSKFKLFQLVKTFLNTAFAAQERHIRRLAKIETLES